MAYEVLARKWRPRQFDDVVGQDHVVQTLKNALTSKRIAHAYLFVGPRGTGKTSIARIFAKALNCAKGPAVSSCDACSPCTEIAAGTSLDVQEIDAASNRGIDEIRALRDNVRFMPTGRHKIYIIDEVHMLTNEAFNALLKTLEEPPPHCKFFLATTEPQKIPLTILSRCQRFDLRRLSNLQIIDRLKVIAGTEGVNVHPHALQAIARASEGGMRDAVSALDQIISFKGKDIGEADVLAVFGLVSRQALDELTTALLKGDIPALVRIVEDFDRHGKDMQRVLLELLEHFRDLLVYTQVGEGTVELDLTAEQLNVLKEQAALTHVDRVLRISDVLVQTLDRLRYALSKKTLLEAALIRCARAAVVASIDELMAELKALKQGLPEEPDGSKNAPRTPAPSLNFDSAPAGPPRAVRETPDPVSREVRPVSPVASATDETARLTEQWHSIVERVTKAAPFARSILVDAKPAAVRGDEVLVEFDPEFADRVDQARMPRNLSALQRVMGDFLGRAVTVVFQVQGAGPASPAPSAGEKNPASGKFPRPNASAPFQSKQRWIANESVRKTLDHFKGSIVDIRE
ncbi:MAG: DNA polymerase III subunit gamma/tau [Lentisphaerae bacterium]|nr:DNA polymerase III subunit gamma/tau [Lentisphaerota bacterium]